MSYSFDPWLLDAMETAHGRSGSTSSSELDGNYKHGQGHGLGNAAPVLRSKKVQYAKTCNVILIPTRQEYFDASIDLWYTRESFERSKIQASMEIKQVR